MTNVHLTGPTTAASGLILNGGNATVSCISH